MAKAALLRILAVALAGSALAGPAAAQLGLPSIGLPGVPPLPPLDIGRRLEDATGATTQAAQRLLRLRDLRVDRLLRQNRDAIERDLRGAPARRGEILLIDPTAAQLETLRGSGLQVSTPEGMDALGLAVVRVNLPKAMSLKEGEEVVRRLIPGGEVVADNLHFQSGTTSASARVRASAPPAPIRVPIGAIDGAPSQRVEAVRGFARGAPAASDHGSAVVSLLRSASAADVRVADIYGSDPAGGGALSLVRGLDWLVTGGAKVVSISLAGPQNTLVGKAVAAAQRRGVIIVAAVGNDGPAAPPAYPASYPGVLAVTGADGRGRALIEAGRASHLDYAAPGADILALNRAGKWVKVRGTSFAAPLVAVRAAAAMSRQAEVRAVLDREAEDLGARGADQQFGRGLLCRTCARTR